LADFWRPSGTADRGTYALVGIIGFAIKHNLDRIVATVGFHRPWGFFNYWVPLRKIVAITELSRSDAAFLATMVALSLPFIWLGVAMTLKRLRSAGLPSHLIIFFFVPIFNLLFFLALCLIPSGSAAAESRQPGPLLPHIIPESVLGNVAVSLLFSVPLGMLFVYLGTRVLTTYGWGLFVAVPFAMGLFAAVIYAVHQPRPLISCIGVACLSVVLLGAMLLAFAWEGVFCLLMAAPLALPLAAFGGAFGYQLQRRRPTTTPPVVAFALLLFLPGAQWFEHALKPASPLLVVRSSIDIQASPEEVWHEVVAFSEIPPPTEWIFRAGIAYPMRAQIAGTGAGAERHCVFSTGAFVEPIEIWDEPRLLKFSVTSNPPPMQEWTPYHQIDTPHLHGYLASEGGQFLLTPLSNGGTHLEGTTWYRHGLWPAAYWRLWSDPIIHQIHMRVLNHIRDEVEASQSAH
jgi:hypothetical protein